MGISNLQDQILQAKVDVLNGGTSISGFPVTLNISDQSLDFTPVFWDTEKDVALSGYKRSNIRGWDLKINLDYNACLEPQKVKDIFDQMPNAIDSANYEFRFFPDASGSDYIEVIPTSDMKYSIQWRATVRRGGSDSVIPKLSFESRQYRDTIDSFFQI